MPATTNAWRSEERPSALFWVAAVALAVLAALLFHLAPGVPIGVPFDEPLKVQFVLTGTQNFQHPILMLDIVRFANLFVGASDPESVTQLGRLIAACSGGLFVFSVIAVARRGMGDIASLGAGVLTAVAPLTLLHAQLFKEDIFVAPWLMFGVLALDRLVEKQGARQAVWFGIAAGLAAAAKYVGLVLLPLSLLPPFWATIGLSRYYKMVGLAAAVAVATFCAVNLPLFVNPQTFLGGVHARDQSCAHRPSHRAQRLGQPLHLYLDGKSLAWLARSAGAGRPRRHGACRAELAVQSDRASPAPDVRGCLVCAARAVADEALPGRRAAHDGDGWCVRGVRVLRGGVGGW